MNPFTEGLYVILRRNRYVGREGETERKRSREQRGEKRKKEMLCNHMNFVLPLTNTHILYIHTPQPTSRLYVSFGLEVCGMGRGATHPPQSSLRGNEHK